MKNSRLKQISNDVRNKKKVNVVESKGKNGQVRLVASMENIPEVGHGRKDVFIRFDPSLERLRQAGYARDKVSLKIGNDTTPTEFEIIAPELVTDPSKLSKQDMYNAELNGPESLRWLNDYNEYWQTHHRNDEEYDKDVLNPKFDWIFLWRANGPKQIQLIPIEGHPGVFQINFFDLGKLELIMIWDYTLRKMNFELAYYGPLYSKLDQERLTLELEYAFNNGRNQKLLDELNKKRIECFCASDIEATFNIIEGCFLYFKSFDRRIPDKIVKNAEGKEELVEVNSKVVSVEKIAMDLGFFGYKRVREHNVPTDLFITDRYIVKPKAG